MKPELVQLEIPIVSSCNLMCKGCTSYSDYNMKGVHDWSQIRQHLMYWNDRIHVRGISLFGGEPTMHPDLPDIIRDTRSINSRATIQVVTNGTYLIERPEIVDALAEIGNSILSVTFHEPEKAYSNDLKEFLLNRYQWHKSLTRDFLETGNRFQLQLNYPNGRFLRLFKGDYGNSKPHNNKPDDGFSNCCFNTGDNAQLHYGKLYRCHPIALLSRVLHDWGQLDDPDWQQYLNYNGLEQSATDSELTEFIDGLKTSESVCGMCPSKTDQSYKHVQWTKRPIAPYA